MSTAVCTPPHPSFLFLPLPFLLGHFSLFPSRYSFLFCCGFFSHSYHSVSPSLPWRSPSIFTATLEATCRVLFGVSPLSPPHAGDTGSCPWPPPLARDPFGSVSSFCPPRAERSPHSFRGRSALCSVCDPVYHPLSLIFHLQLAFLVSPCEPFHPASSSCFIHFHRPHCHPLLHRLGFPVIYVGSACYIISSNQSHPNITFICISVNGIIMIAKYF